MVSVTSVNSLDLPALLLQLIERNRWHSPDDHRVFDNLFDEYADVTFYSKSQMETETRSWISMAVGDSVLRGTPDQQRPPGDIEPLLTVLIGDVGMGFDAPFALDYRTSRVNPRVLRYRWHEKNEHNRWVQISRDFQSFVDVLNLSWLPNQ